MIKDLRSRLKKCQPYHIEHDLLPKLYFKEDENNTEKWIFKYAFIYRHTDETISIRLNYYSRQAINRKMQNILESNRTLIEEFLLTQNK